MEKFAKDVKTGEKFRPYINEKSIKRTSKQFTCTGLPQKQSGQFDMFVVIPCINSKGQVDEVLTWSEETVTIIE